MSTFILTVVTPERAVYEGEVRHISARNHEGYFGILARHAPFMTVLEEGILALDLPDDSRQKFLVQGGCLEFSDNTCTILADGIDQAETSSEKQ